MMFVSPLMIRSLTRFFLLYAHTAEIRRGALLVDTTLTGLWPTDDDWLTLEYVMDQDVVSLFRNTKLCPVECRASLSKFIDKVFNLNKTWIDVLGFEWTTSWQLDFLTFQLFFQFITKIRLTGVEGNHRQEVTNRVSFGFHPTESFPLKKHIKTKGWKEYKVVVDSTVNRAVKLSIISKGYQTTTLTSSDGKQNFVLYLVFVTPLTIRSLTFLFSLPTSHNTVNEKITLTELNQLRAISEAVTESRDIHIDNDWGHIVAEVINGYNNQKDFRLLSEQHFVYEEKLKGSKKPTRENDKYIDAQYQLHQLIAKVLFNTQPAKEAVAQHGLGHDHTVTLEGWTKTCLESAAWIGYLSTPHPVVS